MEPIYIISYPKTGRTWLKVLIGKYLCELNDLPEWMILETGRATAASNLPSTIFTHDGSGFHILPAKLRSYKELSPDKSLYRENRVILLTRNIKDTLVSSYFQTTRRGRRSYRDLISDFVRSDWYGAIKFLTFYKYWYESMHIPRDFLLISYEGLHEDTEKILYQVLKFLGIKEIDYDILREAVKFALFNNLREMEANNYLDSKYLRPGDVNDPESFKIRKGRIGGYLEYLSAEDIKYIDNLEEDFFDCYCRAWY